MEEFMSEQTPTAEAAALNSTANPVGIDGYFGISERGSTIPTEILAGLSTFLAISYIFVINPAILAQAGIPTAGWHFLESGCFSGGKLVVIRLEGGLFYGFTGL